MSNSQAHLEHNDPETAKLGMWLFIFTELLLFGGLFLVYSVFRFKNADAFHLAAHELNRTIGAINTVILLISSMTIAMSITAIQKGHKKIGIILISITLTLALGFLINKYFEWGLKIKHGLYPGSAHLAEFGKGDILFFGLYFAMTGLHALHIIVGMVFISVVLVSVIRNKTNSTDFVLLENSGLYWHLVDIIWIFLFPLFYLIT